MEIVENIALISLNATLLTQAASFLIFLFLINRIMIRPLQATMRERENYIKDMESEIGQSNTALEEMNRELKASEAAVISEANAQREKLKDDGEQQAEEILGEARQEMYKVREDNEKLVNQEIAEARKHIASESEKLATTIMETILDRGVSRG